MTRKQPTAFLLRRTGTDKAARATYTQRICAQAEELGYQAHIRGHEMPAHDAELKRLISNNTVAGAKVVAAWLRGWNRRSLETGGDPYGRSGGADAAGRGGRHRADGAAEKREMDPQQAGGDAPITISQQNCFMYSMRRCLAAPAHMPSVAQR